MNVKDRVLGLYISIYAAIGRAICSKGVVAVLSFLRQWDDEERSDEERSVSHTLPLPVVVVLSS